MIPPVEAPPISMHSCHPPPSLSHKQATFTSKLATEVAPLIRSLHHIHCSMRTQFPDLRLIEYDCGKVLLTAGLNLNSKIYLTVTDHSLYITINSKSCAASHLPRYYLHVCSCFSFAILLCAGKLQTLHTLLRKLKIGGHRVLIFTQMTRMLDVLEQFLNYHGHIYLRLDGNTRVEQRQVSPDRPTIEFDMSVIVPASLCLLCAPSLLSIRPSWSGSMQISVFSASFCQHAVEV